MFIARPNPIKIHSLVSFFSDFLYWYVDDESFEFDFKDILYIDDTAIFYDCKGIL